MFQTKNDVHDFRLYDLIPELRKFGTPKMEKYAKWKTSFV